MARGGDRYRRIVITFADAATHESEVERALLPDPDALQKVEQRRWKLTLNYWDLPIREVDRTPSDGRAMTGSFGDNRAARGSAADDTGSASAIWGR